MGECNGETERLSKKVYHIGSRAKLALLCECKEACAVALAAYPKAPTSYPGHNNTLLPLSTRKQTPKMQSPPPAFRSNRFDQEDPTLLKGRQLLAYRNCLK